LIQAFVASRQVMPAAKAKNHQMVQYLKHADDT